MCGDNSDLAILARTAAKNAEQFTLEAQQARFETVHRSMRRDGIVTSG